MEIEIAQPNQLHIIQKLALEIWPSTYHNIISKQQIDYMLSQMYNLPTLTEQWHCNHTFLMFKNNAQYIGFAHYQINFNSNHDAKLHKLYLLANLQGKGFGKKGLNYIIHEVRTANQKSLILNVNKNNSAFEFYKKIGFTILTEEVLDIGNGFVMDDYVLQITF